ncbi:(2Fe-2S)-binding protein [Persicimonas caeni]|uniref:(2Fe-2S)-binding protein n=1 Tax=Persicimonas caeni TaxID=2292766 RepID=A0A4Y6Q060_PERCE|nr:2Fe-2S iron-sulfur cluster-binding protein [Persicimonas caeni]QDG53912.1 (2Fe-2S)-binding protein [Persicimonas caeni]QED35133.1 (2Fe-2S)-binding protein [Persicimonas caeni]
MPKVEFNGHLIECEAGERLRDVLLRAGETPHNDNAQWLNCRGFGTCGTCAVEIVEGTVGEKTARERWRLDFPPHDPSSGLRLACQIRVEDDLKVTKYPGFWGQHTDEEPIR